MSDFAGSISQRLQSKNWTIAGSQELSDGVTVILGQHTDGLGQQRMILIAVESSVTDVTRKHLKYLLNKKEGKGLDRAIITASEGVSSEVKEVAQSNNIEVLSPADIGIGQDQQNESDTLDSSGDDSESRDSNSDAGSPASSASATLPETKAYELKQVAEMDGEYWMYISCQPLISSLALYRCRNKGLALVNLISMNFFMSGIVITPYFVRKYIQDARSELDSHGIEYTPANNNSKFVTAVKLYGKAFILLQLLVFLFAWVLAAFVL